jgi:hypothetical protein
MKFVSTFKNRNEIRLINFIYPDDKVWNLQIDAFVGTGASTTYYRVLDLRVIPIAIGADRNGQLDTIVIKRGFEPPPAEHAASIIPSVSPKQVATLVDLTNARLDEAGANVTTALERLQTVAKNATITRAVGRAQASLDLLGKVGQSKS